jgi:hypothetical protein
VPRQCQLGVLGAPSAHINFSLRFLLLLFAASGVMINSVRGSVCAIVIWGIGVSTTGLGNWQGNWSEYDRFGVCSFLCKGVLGFL